MPPIRSSSGRASKACDLCRKCKTRCYSSTSGSCLRCETLSLVCSLRDRRPVTGERIKESVSLGATVDGCVSDSLQQQRSVDDRYCYHNEI